MTRKPDPGARRSQPTIQPSGGVAEDVRIRRFHPKHEQAVLELILSIQRQEFDIPITAEDQPDLRAIPSFYQAGSGDFWVAEQGNDIVGTIGLRDIENGQAALRKMFVSERCRGPSVRVGAKLLESLLVHARQKHLKSIYLGTTEQFVAAHRFYEKNGFVPIDVRSLPPTFPLMAVDTRFYQLQLA
jgi:N-acetylglutamate synthase-like GNAT family acetyltransferase